MTGELEQAIAFEETLRERAAERVVPFPFGRALFNDTFADVWYLNALVVERAAGAGAAALVAEADRLHEAAGHAHRYVVVLETAEGERLSPGFRDLGWKVERHLVMAHRGAANRPGDAVAVEEVEVDTVRSLREELARAEPWATGEEVVQSVVDGNALVARRSGGRHFAVKADSKVVSTAVLYSDGVTAQIEAVATLPAHRGNGYASAIVLHALGEATRSGHELVFLVADDEDWPKDLYARLGFASIGRRWAFLRTPVAPGA